MALEVLEALDSARTQWYHITAIVIAGMGFFTDAYDLFCITTVSKLLGRLYYFDPSNGKPGKLPPIVNNFVTGVALVGTLCGQLFFGYLGDKLGRKKVYGITLILMVACALCSGLSFGSSPKSVMTTLCFFRLVKDPKTFETYKNNSAINKLRFLYVYVYYFIQTKNLKYDEW
jgi:PHS family inorganic phosphate transporter-like MFS transporter